MAKKKVRSSMPLEIEISILEDEVEYLAGKLEEAEKRIKVLETRLDTQKIEPRVYRPLDRREGN